MVQSYKCLPSDEVVLCCHVGDDVSNRSNLAISGQVERAKHVLVLIPAAVHLECVKRKGVVMVLQGHKLKESDSGRREGII